MSGSWTVHCKRSPYDVYIGRPSKWGNPFRMASETERAQVMMDFAAWVMRPEQDSLRAAAKRELSGKVLGCWCHPRPCHGDVWAVIANSDNPFQAILLDSRTGEVVSVKGTKTRDE